MPFKSAKQKRWMYANKPAMARRWSAEEKAVSKALEMPNEISKSLPTGYGKKAQVWVGAGGSRARVRRKPLTDDQVKSVPPTLRRRVSQLASDPLSRPTSGRRTSGNIGLATAMRDGMKAQTPGLRQLSRRPGAYNSANSHEGGYLRIRKSLVAVPTTKAQQRRERARAGASGAASGGLLSAGLTAAMNPRGGRLRPAAQMAAVGGAIGAGFGAASKPRKYKLVQKSFVPGKGFVSASELGAKKLREVVKPGQYKSRGLDKKQQAARFAYEGNTKMFAAGKRTPGARTSATRSGTQRITVPGLTNRHGLQGMAWKQGGRKGQRLYMEDKEMAGLPKNGRAFIRRHEEAHVSPKSRTSWRLATVASQPKKLMREEARADMTAGLNYRNTRRDVKRAMPVFQEQQMPGLPWAKKVKPKHRRAAARVEGASHYALAATSEQARSNVKMAHLFTGKGAMFDKKPVAGYQKVQDKMARAKKKQVAKSIQASQFTPYCQLTFPNTTLISKMSPDPSELHVMGSKKGKLKPVKPKKRTAGM